MTIVEDLFCFCYMFLSSFGLLYKLGCQSVVTVQCENSKTFCLKHVVHESSFRYTLTANDLEIRCNSQSSSIWLRLCVFLAVFFQLLAFGTAVYVYYYKPNSDFGTVLQRCVYATGSITGLLICILAVLPFVSYLLPSGGPEQRGVLAEIWTSPLRGLVVLIIKIIIAPFRWIVHNRVKTEILLDKVYENFTCVESTMENNLCQIETQFFLEMPELNCESDFYCTEECYVVMPRIIINSLSFIFASFTLCYRLLKLTHFIKDIDLAQNDGCATLSLRSNSESSDSQDRSLNQTLLDKTSCCEMKDKSVVRPRKQAAGFKAGAGRNICECKNATRNVRRRGEIKEATLQDSQSVETVNLNGNAAATSSEIFDSEEPHLDRASGKQNNADEKTATEYDRARKKQKTTPKKNTQSSESRLIPTSKKHRLGFTEGTLHNSKNGETLTNGHSEYKLERRSKQGKSTRGTSNGLVGKEPKVYRRGTKVENSTGASEVKMGSTGSCNDTEGHEESESPEQWSSNEDIVEGIEGLLVEDESEFYMSGFRL